MAELLKNIYNDNFFNVLSNMILKVLPEFKSKDFIKSIYDNDWESKELKQRMRHVAITLNSFLPGDYNNKVNIILKIIEEYYKLPNLESSFAYMFFPDFIELYGLNQIDVSLQAMEVITQFTSCEFAIRPFIIKDTNKVMSKMLKWSKHKNHHVRRLASEGCRPRLPWAIALPDFKKNPSPVLTILENLKKDPSEYVRRSVANNLNDIAKDNPEVVLTIAKQWKGESQETDWIIKHGCRTLLKKADKEIMSLFGLNNKIDCKINNFQLSTNKLKIGDNLSFSFVLVNKSYNKYRIEFAVYYMKSNGKQNKKLFKITENNFEQNQEYKFKRNLSFKDLTTRKHYAGKHNIAIVVNGIELTDQEFFVTQ